MKIIEIGKSGRFSLQLNRGGSRWDMDRILVSLCADTEDIKFLKNSPEILCETAEELIEAIFEAKLFIKKIESRLI